ncbi:MAG: hypothetical protein SGPRY_009624, partial [Prymnesium sp.]
TQGAEEREAEHPQRLHPICGFLARRQDDCKWFRRQDDQCLLSTDRGDGCSRETDPD